MYELGPRTRHDPYANERNVDIYWGGAKAMRISQFGCSETCLKTLMHDITKANNIMLAIKHRMNSNGSNERKQGRKEGDYYQSLVERKPFY